MKKYILKRIAMSLLTLLLITFVLFVLVRIMPGNPFPSERMSAEQIANKRAEMGLDDPILVQFGRYLNGVLHGDFGKGTSLYYGAPIKTVLGKCIANSFRIGGLAIIIGTAVGLILGITAALNKGTFIDAFCTVFSIVGVCVPGYVFLIFLQYFLSYKAGLFPVWGYENATSLALPVIIGIFSSLGPDVRFYRAAVLDEINKPYVRTARSKGLSRTRILLVHVLRNSLIPVVTYISLSIPFLFTGSLMLETFFGIPGRGSVSINAIHSSDMAVVRAVVVLGALLYQVVNLLTDLLYAWLDPRVRLG